MIAQPFVSPFLSATDRVILGEGPILFQGRLLSTDARRSLLRFTDLQTGETENVDLTAQLRSQGLAPADALPQVLGCAAATADGRLLTALSSGLYYFDPATLHMSLLAHPEAERAAFRPHYNDGKIGPDGAFYVGGMIGDQEGAGRLLRIDGLGVVSEPLVDAPSLTTPNGLHWFPTENPDVWDFYYVCSQYPGIQHYRHLLAEQSMVRQPDLIALPRDTFGYLDGMAGSENGLLFLCLYDPTNYGDGCIVVDVASGEIVERIDTGVPQTTSVALADGYAYITTAAQEYGEAEFARFSQAGAIFRADLGQSELPKVREARAAAPFLFAMR